jgi:hypothetical protein
MGLTSNFTHSQKETKMFTVLSNIRNTNLYIIVALAITLVVILAFAVAPSIAAPRFAVIPVTGISEYADFYQRHPELRAPASLTIETTDYFVRHPELRTPAESDDLSDYFLRH